MDRRDFCIAAASATLLSPDILFARQIRQAGLKRVVIDPRIELMSIVHMLGGYFLTTEANMTYKDDANRYFAKYRSHPAVTLAKKLADAEFAFDRVPDLLLRLTAPDALTWRSDLSSEIPEGIPDEMQRIEFLAALRDFAKVSKFSSFFAQNRRLYNRVVRSIEPGVNPNVEALEAYTGSSLGQWQVIAGLLMLDGGFGPRLLRKDGAFESYSLIGPYYMSSGNPDFTHSDRLQDLIVHELGHSLINPLSDQHLPSVQKYAGRFDALREAMKKVGAYDDWLIVVNEHVLRAVTARVAAQRLGQAKADAAAAEEVKRGFAYIPKLIERLRFYEANRQKWPTLGDYYPELLTAFEIPA